MNANPSVWKTPWCDCKVAFEIDEDGLLWRRAQAETLPLPGGWSLCETDSSGARLVAVFRVEGVPRAEDGRVVMSMLRRIRAIAPIPRARAA